MILTILKKRKRQRLINYDYSKKGAYFVTICTQNKSCLFGSVMNDKLVLNKAGEMINKSLFKFENSFNNIILNKHIIMPNHIHFIITLQNSSINSLSYYIKNYKSYTTVCYIKEVKNGIYPAFTKKLWQKSYYDHIIRNQNEYLNICKYIEENPLKWELDKYYIP